MRYDSVLHGSLNNFVAILAEESWQEWHAETFHDQRFGGWDRYRAWLLSTLPGGKHDS